MRFLIITYKDLIQLVRDWKTVFFLLVMPIVFTVMMGIAFDSADGAQTDSRLLVAVVNQDKGIATAQLLDLLNSSDVIRPEQSDDAIDELKDAVLKSKYAAAVIIPQGFSEQSVNGNVPKLKAVLDVNVNKGRMVSAELQAIMMRLQNGLKAADLSTQIRQSLKPFANSEERTQYYKRALQMGITAWENPPLTVKTQLAAVSNGEQSEQNVSAFAHSSPGMMAQFAIAGLMSAAVIVVMERKNGILKRMLTMNIGRGSILFGHFLTMFLLIITQLTILILFGDLFLGLDYFQEPSAVVVLTVASALFAASLSLFVGVIARKEEQAVLISLLLMLVLSGMGGAWVPLEVTGETFQAVAKFTPLAWMVGGYENILIRGQGLASVLPGVAVLGGYALVLGVLAAWRFRFEER